MYIILLRSSINSQWQYSTATTAPGRRPPAPPYNIVVGWLETDATTPLAATCYIAVPSDHGFGGVSLSFSFILSLLHTYTLSPHSLYFSLSATHTHTLSPHSPGIRVIIIINIIMYTLPPRHDSRPHRRCRQNEANALTANIVRHKSSDSNLRCNRRRTNSFLSRHLSIPASRAVYLYNIKYNCRFVSADPHTNIHYEFFQHSPALPLPGSCYDNPSSPTDVYNSVYSVTELMNWVCCCVQTIRERTPPRCGDGAWAGVGAGRETTGFVRTTFYIINSFYTIYTHPTCNIYIHTEYHPTGWLTVRVTTIIKS